MKKTKLFGISLVLCLFVFLVVSLNATDYKLIKPQRVEIAMPDGLVLVGSFYEVKQTNAPAVILLHMLGRNRGDWNDFARYLQKEGIAVLAIDQRGHGESIRIKDQMYWRWFDEAKYKLLVSDLESVYSYLVGTLGVRQDKVGLFGMNLGANVALNYAGQNPRIASLALLSPGLNYKGISIENSIRMYGARPMYVFCSKNDQYALSSAEVIQSKALGKVKMDVYDYEANSVVLFKKRVNLFDTVSNWFVDTLLK